MQERLGLRLRDWYERHGRDLPWRRTRDAYRIWLSEVILQQTRVQQGMAYYHRFCEAFSSVEELARASEDEVLKLWQGLGYYSRARNLHTAAKQVVERHEGRFPADFEALRALKGVGDYTAAAIASMAFDLPHAVVDGNVYRVLSRLFDIDLAIDSTEGRKRFAELAQELLDKADPATYNQAIMDFGALCCTPQHPSCEACPLADCCLALAAGSVADRPVKQGRTKLRDRYFHYLDLSDGSHTLLHRREAGDIWQGLYELPLIESDGPQSVEELIASDRFREISAGRTLHLTSTTRMATHQLSHQRLHATFYRITIDRLPEQEGWIKVAHEEVGDYAVSRLTERYLQERKPQE